jgi:hypothetical protein
MVILLMASVVVTDKLTTPGPQIVSPVAVGAGGITVGVKTTVTDAVALHPEPFSVAVTV